MFRRGRAAADRGVGPNDSYLDHMTDYTDPARTLALLNELEGVGMSNDAFSILHHFQSPETIQSHTSYCRLLSEEGSRFRTRSNPLVQRRLEMVLAMYRAGGFKETTSALFEHLAHAAVLEVPFDRRPLAEQLRDAQ